MRHRCSGIRSASSSFVNIIFVNSIACISTNYIIVYAHDIKRLKIFCISVCVEKYICLIGYSVYYDFNEQMNLFGVGKKN